MQNLHIRTYTCNVEEEAWVCVFQIRGKSVIQLRRNVNEKPEEIHRDTLRNAVSAV